MPAGSAKLFTARYLLPVAAPPIEGGALLAANGHILAVGTRKELSAAHPGVPLVDFGDAVMLPPLANAHTHLELSHFPDWAADAGEPETGRDFVAWILRLVKVRRRLSADQIAASLAAGLIDSLRAGTGVIGDICTSLDTIAAYRSSPLSGRVFAEVLGHDAAAVAARLEAIRALLGTPPGPSLCWGLSPHAPYSLSAAALEQTLAFTAGQALQNAIHLAESNEESRFVRDGRGAIADRLFAAAGWDPALEPVPGCSPVHALCGDGRLRSGDLVVHGVQVDDADIALLKRSGCHVVLCPRSNAALEVGKAPVAAYLSAGVPLSLGTDSLASAPSLSVWEELAFARSWFAGAASPRTWLEIATLGGARALGLEGKGGTLAAGRDASFQVVRLPDLPPLAGLEESLCAAGSSAEVMQLYLAGQNVLPES